MRQLKDIVETSCQLCAVLHDKSFTPRMVADFVRELYLYADMLSGYYLKACNTGLSDREEKLMEAIEDRLKKFCEKHLLIVKHNRDPRGWPIHLKLPDGASNSLSSYWAVG